MDFISGNLNDGPKDGENKPDKPTEAPFESERMYDGIAIVSVQRSRLVLVAIDLANPFSFLESYGITIKLKVTDHEQHFPVVLVDSFQNEV